MSSYDPASEEEQDIIAHYNRLFSSHFKTYPALYKRVMKIFSLALEKKESGIILSEDELNIIVFYMIKTILAAFDNRVLENHVANLLSKVYHKRLLNETAQNLVVIGQKMNFDCHFEQKATKIGNVMYPYWVQVYKYVPIAALLKDSSYQLINRNVHNGKVYLLKDNVARLLQEVIRRKIVPDRQKSSGELMELLQKIKSVSVVIKDLSDLIEKKKLTQTKYDNSNIYEDMVYALYPPCIKFILNKATNGVTTTGEVIELTREITDPGSPGAYYPVVAFTLPSGEAITFTSDFGSSPASHKVGQRVIARYDPDEPQNAEIASAMSKWLLPGILAFIGVIVCCLSVFLIPFFWLTYSP